MHNLSHCKKNCADTHHLINLFCQIFDQQCLVFSLLVLFLSTVIISKQHFVCVQVSSMCMTVKWNLHVTKYSV